MAHDKNHSHKHSATGLLLYFMKNSPAALLTTLFLDSKIVTLLHQMCGTV